MSEQKKIRIDVVKNIAVPPFFGGPGDTILIDEFIGEALIKNGDAVLHVATAPAEVEAPADAEPVDPDLEKKVDDHVQGLSELFETQQGAQADPEVKETKGKKK